MKNELILKDSYFTENNEFTLQKTKMTDFWKTIISEVSQTTLQRFGIEHLVNKVDGFGGLNDFKDGGDISTVHNADKGVFVDDEHRQRYQLIYNKDTRKKYYEGRKTDSNDTRLATQRKRLFQNENVIDGYTGKNLSKDGSTHLDHIISAKEIHENKRARLFMSNDERNDMAVDERNIVPTNSSLNQSKGEHDLDEWLDKPSSKDKSQTNQERFGINKEDAHKLKEDAKSFVNDKINAARAKEVTTASISRGVKQAKKQIVGLIFYYGQEIIVDSLKELALTWKNYSGIKQRLFAIKECGNHIKDKVITKIKDIKTIAKDIFNCVSEGFISGVTACIVEGIINMFLTTVKNVSKLLQDGITGLISVVKLWIKNPENLPKNELVKSSIKLISGILATSLGIIAEESIRSGFVAVFPALTFLAEPVGIVGGILVTGCLSGLVLYIVDNFGKIVQSIKNSWETIEFGLANSVEDIENRYQMLVSKIDEAYQGLLQQIERHYKKLNKLSELAYDTSMPVGEQFNASISYARATGVNENKILHNLDEIDAYFLN